MFVFLRLLPKDFIIVLGWLEYVIFAVDDNSRTVKFCLHIHVPIKVFVVMTIQRLRNVVYHLYYGFNVFSNWRQLVFREKFSYYQHTQTYLVSACFSLSFNEPRISTVPWFFLSALSGSPRGLKNELYTCVAWQFPLVA